MTGTKMTLKNLYEEFKTFKDKHDKEMSELRKIIQEQGTKIKMLERLPTLDKTADIQKKSRENDKPANFTVKSSEKNYAKQLKCNMCDKRFGKFSDLELHIKDKHANHKGQNCDHCGKTFVTAWRLRKHMRIHVQKFTNLVNSLSI